MVEKILAHEFTPERFDGIIRRAMRQSAPGLQFNPDYYFPFMWNGMRNGMVSAWRGESALLVAMFYPHIFTGAQVGVVSLWAGNRSPDTLKLLAAFEAEARSRKCVSVHASSFGAGRSEAMRRLYRKRGYAVEEISFMKGLH